MVLPLFDGPDGGPVERIGIHSPEYRAFWTGFQQGVDGQAKSRWYDEDDRVRRYYEDGHRIGGLFRPPTGT